MKLILHALHENNVPFINNGEPVDVIEISTGVSLGFIIGVLVVTVVASLLSPKGRAQTYVAAARRHAHEFLDIEQDPAYCDEIYHKLLDEEEHLRSLPEKYRKRIRQERGADGPAAQGAPGARDQGGRRPVFRAVSALTRGPARRVGRPQVRSCGCRAW